MTPKLGVCGFKNTQQNVLFLVKYIIIFASFCWLVSGYFVLFCFFDSRGLFMKKSPGCKDSLEI